MKKFISIFSIFILSLVLIGCNTSLGTTTTSITSQDITTFQVSTLPSSTNSSIPTSIFTTTSSITTSSVPPTTSIFTTTTPTTTSTPTTTTTTPATTTTTQTTTTSQTTVPITTTTQTQTTKSPLQTIEIYSVNDIHGLAYMDSTNFNNAISGFAKLGNFLNNQKNMGKDAIFIANGDILQGSALSNYYYGLPMIEALNAMQFDGFVLGNHEFDWGIDKVENYKDGNAENGEANYPFLAANIVSKATGEQMPWTVPYIIKQFGDVKVGVIGVIGDVYNSISPSRVEDYIFLPYVEVVREYTHYLRTQQGVDIIIVSVHGYELSRNQEIASYRGDYLVDAILNGHTHSSISQYIDRSGTRMPYVQTSASATSTLAKITLVFNHDTKSVTSATAQILGTGSFGSEDPQVRLILDVFASDETYVAFISEVLSQSVVFANTSSLATWGASVIRDYMGVDIGVINSGGFRKGIPLGNFTMGFFVEVYPFDNYIKTVELSGAAIINLYASSSLIFDDKFNVSTIVSSQMYTVAAVDYVFDQTRYPFLTGQNPTLTSILMRDLLVQDLRNSNGTFNPNTGTSYPQ
ncbi:MAG: bifunctional UDP-sugar hydrolase/5'-nucleotidase [Candidatus Izemoplasmatales bacterium]|nr:bifunctional UDP-sugar hydrolase/5'-nucleotidase [Candidatus Izemoplasmatales bacterium]